MFPAHFLLHTISTFFSVAIVLIAWSTQNTLVKQLINLVLIYVSACCSFTRPQLKSYPLEMMNLYTYIYNNDYLSDSHLFLPLLGVSVRLRISRLKHQGWRKKCFNKAIGIRRTVTTHNYLGKRDVSCCDFFHKTNRVFSFYMVDTLGVTLQVTKCKLAMLVLYTLAVLHKAFISHTWLAKSCCVRSSATCSVTLQISHINLITWMFIFAPWQFPN